MEEDVNMVQLLLRMRSVVGLLGESGPDAWWKTGFRNTTGEGYLKLIFPRTAASAGIVAASAAACRLHDERIGRGRVAHLFRLPHVLEGKLHELLQGSEAETVDIASAENAFQVLETLAEGSRGRGQPGGPIRIGDVSELPSMKSISAAAAVYLHAFRENKPTFPYFTEPQAEG